MAITDINLSGKVRADDGSGVSGATVTIHETAAGLDGSQEGSADTTDSDGTWSFTETTLTETYDIKISSSGGGQIRYIPWSDEIALKTVDASVMKIRGVASAAAPLYFFADRADDAGDAWRVQASNSDTLAIGSDKASAGTIIDYITITNGATAAASNTTILGQLTIGVNDTGADVKFFGATAGSYWLWDESADGVVQIGTLTVGVDDAGHDVKFFGATASAYMLWDESADDLVLAGAAGLDVAGDIDVDGTTNLDAVDIDGNVQLDGTLTVGVDDTGLDVKFFGATTNTYMLWDESTDDLVLTLGAELYFYDAGGGEHIKSDGTDMTIYAGADLNLTAGTDINIPADVGLTFGNDGEKIEGGGTDLTISGNKVNLTPTEDVFVANGTGLVIGHTAQITNAQLAELQVLGTGAADSMAILGRWSADSGAPELAFVKSRDPAIADGSFAIVENGDPVGQLRFYPDDGADFQTLAASFRGVVDDASPAAGDIGMAFVWSQMPGGGGGLAETMRLTAAGSLTLNQASTISTAAGALTLDPTTDIIVAAGKEVVIGHTAPLNVRDTWENTPTPQLSVVATTSPTIAIVTNNATAARGGSLVFVRSKSNTLGSVTSVADGDALGGIGWVGADGNDYYTQAAKITAFVDGTPGTDDMPGRLSFATTSDGGGLATERMRLDSAGFLSLRSSVDTAVVADVVGFSRYEIGAGNTVLGISQETAVASDTDETKFSHKLQVRINGATYFIMLTDT